MAKKQNDEYLIGVMSGKLDAMAAQSAVFTTSFNAHVAQDDARISALNDKMQAANVRMAWYGGALAVLISVFSVLGPVIANKLFP